MALRLITILLGCALFVACGGDEEKLEADAGGGGGEKDGGEDKEIEPPLLDQDLPARHCDFYYECRPERYASHEACVSDTANDIWRHDELGQGCGDAARTLYRCLIDLADCEELLSYYDDESGEAYPCQAEEEAIEVACSTENLAEEGDHELAEAFCELVYECTPEQFDDLEECRVLGLEDLVYARVDSPACGVAVEGLLGCISELNSCDEYAEYEEQSGSSGDYPCSQASAIVSDSCEF